MEIQQIRDEIAMAKGTLERLQASLEVSLAEAEKPKLRHGDYGYDIHNQPCAAMEVFETNGPRITGPSTVCSALCNISEGTVYKPKVILGNIFDDLTAIAEPLKEFKTDVHLYRIERKGFPDAPIYMAGNHHSIAEVKEHIRKLRRMVATAERST